MKEVLLEIIVLQLGFQLLFTLGIFGLESYSLYIRYRDHQNDQKMGTLRILSPEEMVARGINPDSLMPNKKVEPLPTAASGQYL